MQPSAPAAIARAVLARIVVLHGAPATTVTALAAHLLLVAPAVGGRMTVGGLLVGLAHLLNLRLNHWHVHDASCAH